MSSNRDAIPAGESVAVPWRIRGATESDYDAIVSVWGAAGLPYRPKGRDTREAYVRQLARFGALYLVAEADARVIGVVFGTHDERKGWINRLAVEPAWRRQGVARALVEACEVGFQTLGIDIIAALIEPENLASKALFDDLGYRTDVPVCYYRKLGNPEI
ncbi:MAG: GNAT family N-acetyltransferase [Phycisphaerae bacterium]|nr:GNAT family N-acetyltransferase [Phycisphaerae bacterium]